MGDIADVVDWLLICFILPLGGIGMQELHCTLIKVNGVNATFHLTQNLVQKLKLFYERISTVDLRNESYSGGMSVMSLCI